MTSDGPHMGQRPDPVLSVCLITKNEADRLPSALASVRHVAADVVVVDTGSTDDTIAVAASCGARVIEHPWNNDFSRARNVSLDAARGEWILCLDADEKLAPNQEARLRKLLGGTADAYFVRIRSPQAGRQAGQTFVHAFPRLFRNRPGIRFRGRVHEQIQPSLAATGARIRHSDLEIEHDGYAVDGPLRRAKLERNLELLRMDLEDRPQDAFVLYHLGETHALLDDPAAAQTCYRRALATESLPVEYTAAALQNLASVFLRLNDLDSAIEAAEQALGRNPDALTSLLILGSARCRRGESCEAIRTVDRYLRESTDPSRRRKRALMRFEPDRGRAYLIRGESCLRSGRLEEAERDAAKALESAPGLAAVHRLMARVAMARGSANLAEPHLRRAVELDPDHAETRRDLALTQAEGGSIDEALATIDAALRNQKQAFLYDCQGLLRIKAGDLGGAAESYRRLLDLEPECVDAHRRLAGLYQKAGDSDRARAHLARLAEGRGQQNIPIRVSSRRFPEHGAPRD